jgi:UDP-glucuronate 4-epimerase
MRVGITGGAGFIGHNLSKALLTAGFEVVSIDSLNPAYGPQLAEAREKDLYSNFGLKTLKLDLSEISSTEIAHIFKDCDFIFHLAAFAGVEKGNSRPDQYFKSNVIGFSNIAQAIRVLNPAHFFFASSSSIYGSLSGNLIDEDAADGRAIQSYYAATKWINEIEARSLFALENVSYTALRFFTVYGPWGRPDMAYFKFLSQLINSEKIYIRGVDGGSRQFTYIDDVVSTLLQLISLKTKIDFKALNIASNVAPRKAIEILQILMKETNLISEVHHIERPAFDVESTIADLTKLKSLGVRLGSTNIEHGLLNFIDWHREYSRSR